MDSLWKQKKPQVLQKLSSKQRFISSLKQAGSRGGLLTTLPSLPSFLPSSVLDFLSPCLCWVWNSTPSPQNVVKVLSWLLMQPYACILQNPPPRQESESVGFRSDTCNTNSFGKFWGENMSNEDEDRKIKNKCEFLSKTPHFLRTLIVVSGQDSSFSLAQLNYFILSFQIGVW